MKTAKASRRGFLLAVCLGLTCLSGPQPSAQAIEPSVVKLKVHQTFHSDQGSKPPSDTFTYQMTPKSTGTSGTYNFDLTGNSSIELGPLSFNEPGFYSYDLRCTSASKSGYHIDKRTYTVKIQVTNDATVVVNEINGTKYEQLDFAQSYSSPNSVTVVDPPVKKTITGDIPPKDDVFVFQLKADNPEYPMPPGSNNDIKLVTILGAGEAEFGSWVYQQAGVYSYTIRELHTALAGYDYDSVIYTITDTVTEQDGQLIVARTINNQFTDGVGQLDFTNNFNSNNVHPDTGGEIVAATIASPIFWIVAAVGGLILFVVLLRRRQIKNSR